MKKLFSLLAFAALVSFTQAKAAVVNHVYCQGSKLGVGGTAVTFTGGSTFNVTEFNAFGLPLSQQAVVVNSLSTSRSLSFDLRGLLTGMDYHLVLFAGTYDGVITTRAGSMNLVCTSLIQL